MKSSGDHPDYRENKKKSKRNRQKTECNAIRKAQGCGICGSENIAVQGVKYCNMCGEEVDFLAQDQSLWFMIKTGDKVPCECVEERVVRNKPYAYRDIRTISVKKCMDCGATMSNYCPNCKTKGNWVGDRCWKSVIGWKLYCKRCGFRN